MAFVRLNKRHVMLCYVKWKSVSAVPHAPGITELALRYVNCTWCELCRVLFLYLCTCVFNSVSVSVI